MVLLHALISFKLHIRIYNPWITKTCSDFSLWKGSWLLLRMRSWTGWITHLSIWLVMGHSPISNGGTTWRHNWLWTTRLILLTRRKSNLRLILFMRSNFWQWRIAFSRGLIFWRGKRCIAKILLNVLRIGRDPTAQKSWGVQIWVVIIMSWGLHEWIRSITDLILSWICTNSWVNMISYSNLVVRNLRIVLCGSTSCLTRDHHLIHIWSFLLICFERYYTCSHSSSSTIISVWRGCLLLIIILSGRILTCICRGMIGMLFDDHLPSSTRICLSGVTGRNMICWWIGKLIWLIYSSSSVSSWVPSFWRCRFNGTSSHSWNGVSGNCIGLRTWTYGWGLMGICGCWRIQYCSSF